MSKKDKDAEEWITTAIFDEDGYSDDLGDGPVGELTVVEDFLPPPEELAKARKMVKTTIELDLESVNFFKKKAKELGVPYQRMIRNLIDEYANKHKDGG